MDPVWAPCQDCGALVVVAERHVEWHARLTAAVPQMLPGVTVLDPSTGEQVQLAEAALPALDEEALR